MAFEEENWPRRIDDPLFPEVEICPKRRLHDTIKCLNRRQENKIVRFRGDGTGTGVLWELWENDPIDDNTNGDIVNGTGNGS